MRREWSRKLCVYSEDGVCRKDEMQSMVCKLYYAGKRASTGTGVKATALLAVRTVCDSATSRTCARF